MPVTSSSIKFGLNSKACSFLTLREKSDVDEPRLHEDLWQHEAEGRDDVDEGRRGAAVVPRGPHEPARPSQDGGRVHGAGAQLVAQLVAVVG